MCHIQLGTRPSLIDPHLPPVLITIVQIFCRFFVPQIICRGGSINSAVNLKLEVNEMNRSLSHLCAHIG